MVPTTPTAAPTVAVRTDRRPAGKAFPAPARTPAPSILLKTRFALDQYINLRPVKLYPNVETPLKDKGPEHIDFVVVRENTGVIYIGIGGVTHKGTPLESTVQVMTYSRPVAHSREHKMFKRYFSFAEWHLGNCPISRITATRRKHPLYRVQGA
jgi:isocitrate/isopropylmalate dehydrogenase